MPLSENFNSLSTEDKIKDLKIAVYDLSKQQNFIVSLIQQYEAGIEELLKQSTQAPVAVEAQPEEPVQDEQVA
jgi:hypothetical protein